MEPGQGREVENKIKGGAIQKEFIPGVEKGVLSVAESGILAGFPVIDYKVTILDGLHHDVDSSVLAFEIASRMCFREACQKASLISSLLLACIRSILPTLSVFSLEELYTEVPACILPE